MAKCIISSDKLNTVTGGSTGGNTGGSTGDVEVSDNNGDYNDPDNG